MTGKSRLALGGVGGHCLSGFTVLSQATVYYRHTGQTDSDHFNSYLRSNTRGLLGQGHARLVTISVSEPPAARIALVVKLPIDRRSVGGFEKTRCSWVDTCACLARLWRHPRRLAKVLGIQPRKVQAIMTLVRDTPQVRSLGSQHNWGSRQEDRIGSDHLKAPGGFDLKYLLR